MATVAEIPRVFKGSAFEEPFNATAEEKLLSALDKVKRKVDNDLEKVKQKVDSDITRAQAAKERMENVIEGIKTNMELIKPVVTKLIATAKINKPLPELVQKFTVDVPSRFESLADLRDMLDKPDGEWLDVKERKDFAHFDWVCRCALAAYGPASLRSNALVAPKSRDSHLKGSEDFRACIAEYAGVPPEDVIYISTDEWEDTMAEKYSKHIRTARSTEVLPLPELCPAFYVAIDHKTKTIVLSVRGTLTLADMMTDCIADASAFPAAGLHALAHSGIAKVTEMVRERCASALEAAAGATGYCKLLITGHSLGGATAHLLAISYANTQQQPGARNRPDASLPPSIREISAVAFGPPPYVSIKELECVKAIPDDTRVAVSLRAFVHDLDMIPRTSLHGMLLFAAFLAGEEAEFDHSQNPDLYLPLAEVVLVREEQEQEKRGVMKYMTLHGSHALLSSGLLIPMLAGLKQAKPVEHHMPPQYDKILRAHRPADTRLDHKKTPVASARGAAPVQGQGPDDSDGENKRAAAAAAAGTSVVGSVRKGAAGVLLLCGVWLLLRKALALAHCQARPAQLEPANAEL